MALVTRQNCQNVLFTYFKGFDRVFKKFSRTSRLFLFDFGPIYIANSFESRSGQLTNRARINVKSIPNIVIMDWVYDRHVLYQ